MKRICLYLIFVALRLSASAQSVGIGTNTPDGSAALDVSSVTQGMLVPRMTTEQREMIASPAVGLLVYDMTSQTFWFRDNMGWTELVAGGDTEVHRNGPDILYMGMTDSVGIGIMTPDTKLQVKTGDNQFGISHTDGLVDLSTFVDDLYGGWLGTKSNHPLNLYAGNGTFQFTMLPNGDVGLGMPFPTNRLDILGTTRSGIHASGRPLYITGDIGAASGGIEFRHTNGTQGIGFGYNTIYAAGSVEDQSLGFAAKGLGSLTFNTFVFERMRISEDGYVGIGTAAPHAFLQITNTLTPKKLVLHETADNNNQFTGFGTPFKVLRYQIPSTDANHIFYAGTSATSSNELMRISGNGQVMIGTTTAATGHLLSVGGKIAAEEILVDLKVDWPDYVFEDDYTLNTLVELRNFISAKGHLPGVPSATTVKEKGIYVGEMNAVLLRKIEELTLYILQQEDRMNKLESHMRLNK